MRWFQSPMAVDTIFSEEVLICSAILLPGSCRSSLPGAAPSATSFAYERGKKWKLSASFPHHDRHLKHQHVSLYKLFFLKSFRRELDVAKLQALQSLAPVAGVNLRHLKR